MRGFHDGLARVLFWRTDSSNRCIGQGASLANAATSAAYVAENAIAARLTPSAPEGKKLRGGDKDNVAEIQYGGGKGGTFQVVISDSDSALYAMLMNMVINSTLNSVWDFYAENNNLTFSITGGCAIQQRNELTSGAHYWHTVFYPACQFHGMFGGAEYRGDAPLTITVTPSLSTTAHTGQSFGTGAANWVQNLEGDKTDAYHIDSAHPLHVLAVRKDGSITTANTVFKPISTIVTVNATPNFNVINNTPTALASITLAGVATFAAGTAADLLILTHETDYVPI
jgi:hypothetical protein